MFSDAHRDQQQQQYHQMQHQQQYRPSTGASLASQHLQIPWPAVVVSQQQADVVRPRDDQLSEATSIFNCKTSNDTRFACLKQARPVPLEATSDRQGFVKLAVPSKTTKSIVIRPNSMLRAIDKTSSEIACKKQSVLAAARRSQQSQLRDRLRKLLSRIPVQVESADDPNLSRLVSISSASSISSSGSSSSSSSAGSLCSLSASSASSALAAGPSSWRLLNSSNSSSSASTTSTTSATSSSATIGNCRNIKPPDRRPLVIKYYSDSSLDEILSIHFSCAFMQDLATTGRTVQQTNQQGQQLGHLFAQHKPKAKKSDSRTQPALRSANSGPRRKAPSCGSRRGPTPLRPGSSLICATETTTPTRSSHGQLNDYASQHHQHHQHQPYNVCHYPVMGDPLCEYQKHQSPQVMYSRNFDLDKAAAGRQVQLQLDDQQQAKVSRASPPPPPLLMQPVMQHYCGPSVLELREQHQQQQQETHVIDYDHRAPEMYLNHHVQAAPTDQSIIYYHNQQQQLQQQDQYMEAHYSEQQASCWQQQAAADDGCSPLHYQATVCDLQAPSDALHHHQHQPGVGNQQQQHEIHHHHHQQNQQHQQQQQQQHQQSVEGYDCSLGLANLAEPSTAQYYQFALAAGPPPPPAMQLQLQADHPAMFAATSLSAEAATGQHQPGFQFKLDQQHEQPGVT